MFFETFFWQVNVLTKNDEKNVCLNVGIVNEYRNIKWLLQYKCNVFMQYFIWNSLTSDGCSIAEFESVKVGCDFYNPKPFNEHLKNDSSIVLSFRTKTTWMHKY